MLNANDTMNTVSARIRDAIRRVQAQPWRTLRYVVIAAIAALALFPLYYMFVLSLLTAPDAAASTPRLLPDWDWGNYARAWSLAPWPRYFLNSVLIAGVTIALALVTSLLAGYAFGTMRFPGRQALFLAILGLIMVPFEATLIPNYLILSALGWIDTYQAQIIPFAVSIPGIFLLRQFFLSLPPSLYEAAQLDGCSRFGYLWRIAAPLARPSLAVIALQVFIGSWNAFLWPFLVTTTDAIRPIEVGLQAFTSIDGTDPTGLAAAAAFTTLPVLVVFLIAQRQFIEGISAGGATG